jgi:hypothetical protein
LRLCGSKIICKIEDTAPQMTLRRVKENLRNDKKLERKITKIEKKLNVSRMKT